MTRKNQEPTLQEKYDILLQALVAVFAQDHKPDCKMRCVIHVAECPNCPDYKSIIKEALCHALGKKAARKLVGETFDWVKS